MANPVPIDLLQLALVARTLDLLRERLHNLCGIGADRRTHERRCVIHSAHARSGRLVAVVLGMGGG